MLVLWSLAVTLPLVLPGPGVAGGAEEPRIPLHIAGLFPLSSASGDWMGQVGSGVLPAVKLALEAVNDDRDLLPGHELCISWNDTECDMAVGTRLFFDMMHDPPPKVILFGDACSRVTAPIAESAKWWKIWQLSYADTNPALSDRKSYPNFFRTVPSDSASNPARVAFLDHYNWTRVGTLFQDASRGSSRYAYAHGKLTELLDNTGSFDRVTESFATDPKPAITNLKAKDIRIIIGNFDSNMACRVFCAAYQEKMFGPKHVWLIPGDYPPNWWKRADKEVSCTPEQLQEALQGYFGTDVLPLSTNNQRTVSGLRPRQYERRYNAARGEEYSKFHGYAYDGVWVIAKALHALLERAGGALNMRDVRSESMARALNDTDFTGVTGRIKFNNGDRVGSIQLQQLQGSKMRKIAVYDTADNSLTEAGASTLWQKRGLQPPRDSTIRRTVLHRVNTSIYAALCTVAALGIALCIAFLTVNIRFRNHRYIKMSSPHMNNLIVAGCILTYTTVFLLGTDGIVSPQYFHAMCSARSWVLCIGFTLSFGAMFSKTWRVHAIFTNIKLNKKVIRDSRLVLIVVAMLALDCFLLTAWQAKDPLYRDLKHLPPEIVYDPAEGEVEVTTVLEMCVSDHHIIWLSAIYVYKGLLLIFGCFLAWETRQVTIPALNDSKYIGMSVYNVVIMCVSGVPVSFIINDKPDAAYLIIALFIIFCTTITLCLVFMPKLVQLRRDPKGDEKRIRATLRKTSRREDSGTDWQQRIQKLTEENLKYSKIVEQRTFEMQQMLLQLGDGGYMQRPALTALSLNHAVVTNTKPSADESSSTWPKSTNHCGTETIELSEISRPPVYDLPLSLALVDPCPLHPPPPYDSCDPPRRPCRAVRTPSYQGLKMLSDLFPLKETAILSDSEPDSVDSASEHEDDGADATTSLLS